MKKILLTSVAGLVVSSAQLLFVSEAEAGTFFTAILNSSQEVPPAGVTNSTETGFATLELVENGINDYSLKYNVTVSSGLDFASIINGTPVGSITGASSVTRLHIHNAARGVNGGVVYGIFNPDQDFNNNVSIAVNGDGTTTIQGSWDITDGSPVGNILSFVNVLKNTPANQDVPLYFNIHTVADPSGVIRGQIVATPESSNLLGLVIIGGLGLTMYRKWN